LDAYTHTLENISFHLGETLRHVTETAIGGRKRNWSFGRFQLCGRDQLGSSLDPAVALEPTSDNNKNSAISIVLPTDTPRHQWIRMKLAKSLLIFAKVLMNLRLSCAQIVRATSSAANHPARLLKIATG
jgi:hypothetical protein